MLHFLETGEPAALSSKVLAQPNPADPLFWLAVFFLTGLAATLVIAVPVSVVHAMKRRALRKRAERMGVELGVSGSGGSGISGMDIEACGYCVVFLVAVILGALGVSLPIILPQSAVNLIMAVICVVFGALFWGLTIAVIPYSVRDLRRLNRALQAAAGAKTSEVSQKRHPEN